MQTETRSLVRQARLRYVTDEMAGIRRCRRGRGFCYYSPTGRLITRAAERERIRALAIPPAWVDVWICPLPHGHLQATGRDAKGRKQYRYHPQWNERARQANFHSVLDFGRALPKIRRAVDNDLRRHATDQRRVVATVIALLDETLIRVGNVAYARENHSFGLTTLRRRHVKFSPATATFRFRGKGGAWHEVDVRQRRLVRALHRCCELPGQELFQYLDAKDGQFHPIDSEDVNAYIQEAAGPEFSAKDFRTWTGTALMAGMLCRATDATNGRQRQKALRQAYQQVAAALRNTVAVCRKHYVHPELPKAFDEGRLQPLCEEFQTRRRRWYSPDEQLALHLLERL